MIQNKTIKIKKEAFDLASKEALKVMQYILTGYKCSTLWNYINFSYSAEDAPEALKVMQRPDTPYPDGYLGSIPSWGASVLFTLDNREVII